MRSSLEKYTKNFLILILTLSFVPFIQALSNAQGISDAPYSTINTDQLNIIEAIGFEAKEGVATITIESDEMVQYEVIPGQKDRLTLKLKNVILAQKFQVARDVTEYDSPVSFISSFRDPVKEDDVLIVIEFKEQKEDEIESDVIQGPNLITVNVQVKVLDEQERLAQKSLQEQWAFDIRVATTPGAAKNYRGELVSFDFKDADVRDVLRILADISGFNMVVAKNVSGTVTLKLNNIPWDQALDVVLEDAGLGAIVEGNVMKIAPLGTLQARQRAIRAASASKEEFEPLITKQVFVNYARAEELEPLADPLLSQRGEMRIDIRTNSVLVTDVPLRVNEIAELLEDLDTRTPQVLIESRIVQATLDFTRELGVQWGFNYQASAETGNPTGATFPASINAGGANVGDPFGTAGDTFIVDLPAAAGTGAGGAFGLVLGSLTGAYDLDIRISALENRGDGRVLSSPKVLTLDNTPARIEQGVSIPFLSVSAAGTQTQFVDATLRLEVTPQVTNDDRVLMTIKVTDNAPDDTLTGANGQPSIRRNEAETQVLATDGETIVIGGIFTRAVTESEASVPWFSRIPLFGWLFQNTSSRDQRRELIVFITPRIVR